jgi:hypothetical protein
MFWRFGEARRREQVWLNRIEKHAQMVLGYIAVFFQQSFWHFSILAEKPPWSTQTNIYS